MPVTFHSLEDVSTAPEGVKQLVAGLQTPLCGKQKLEALPSMTPLALAQLQRVEDQASDTCSTPASFDTISSVANLVLTTSAAIEQLSYEGNGLEARSMIPHWYTLLRTIARASHPDVQITARTPFIYPRGFGGEEGVAEMLMGFAADKAIVGLNLEPEHPEHPDIDVTSSACPEGLCPLVEDHESIAKSGAGVDSDVDGDEDAMVYEEDDYTEESYDAAREFAKYGLFDDIPVYDEAKLFFGLDAIGEHESPEEIWLDLPRWSHILPWHDSGPTVLFPILCVASETEIVPLMASAAYQRHTWGVDLPVVGLETSAFSCSARVYISWVDASSDVQHMPTVHVMRPKLNAATRNSDVLPLPGSFDFADPQSALALAHFMFSLSYQSDMLQEELPSRRLRKFTWRSDDDAAPWAGSIEEWRAHIDRSDASSTSDASDTPSPITPKDIDTFTMPPKPASGRGRGKGEDKSRSAPLTALRAPSSQSGGASNPHIDNLKDADANDSNETTDSGTGNGAGGSGTKASSNACSKFARRSLANSFDNEKPTTTNWMLYRSVFTLTRTPGWNGYPPELSRHLAFYDQFTCLRWPKEWTELDRVTSVDSCLVKLRAQLFNEYEAFKANHQETSAEVAPPELEAPLASIVDSRLSFLLKCVDSAYTKASRKKHALEIECRHDFDALFMNFFVDDPNTPTSSEVFLECRLRLAQNALLGHFRDKDAAEDSTHSPKTLATHLEDWLTLNQRIAREIRGETLTLHAARAEDIEMLHEQCYAAESGAANLSNKYATLRKRSDFRDMVEQHSTKEPDSGTCDAALVTSIPIALNHTTEATQKAHQSALEQSQLINLSTDQSQNDKPAAKPRRGLPLYNYPTRVHSGDYPPYHGPTEVPSDKTSLSASRFLKFLYILLPQLLVEYKRANQHGSQALNQARMYCISALRYYASMNIRDYPVFGFAVDGKEGALVMGWMSDNEVMYLLERNTRRFDITQPIQAFHLATIVMRLKARETELREIFEARAKAYVKDLSNGKFEPWAAEKLKPTNVLATVVESAGH